MGGRRQTEDEGCAVALVSRSAKELASLANLKPRLQGISHLGLIFFYCLKRLPIPLWAVIYVRQNHYYICRKIWTTHTVVYEV